ncbi:MULTISPECIES: DUF6121 family protein [unclassified Diaminobutyricimonas]|uniref:DUF6121 family protein n=1 Tax=unclassified Diaminobutyricimonas TaxID=2643261 RepID=UPI0012F4D97C|nr:MULTISPECIES: DUF6121 family protein [unclassified Diaminobutyricimonas]
MSAPTPPRPSSIFLALLATVTYIACVISAWGLISYFLDRSPIENPDAGTLIGPVMVFTAAVVTFFNLRALKTMRSPVGRAAVAIATTYLAMVVVVFIGASIVVAEVAAGPFLITAALLSGVTVVAVWRYEHPKRPPWRDPREDPGD